MNSVLRKIAVGIGGMLFLASLAMMLLNGVSVLTALWRAAMIMVLSSIVVSLFFQYFARVLYRFIEEQRRIQEEEAAKVTAKAEAEKKEREKQAQAAMRATSGKP